MQPIDAENIIAWLNAKIEKARRGDLPVDAIALYGDALMFVKNLPKVKPKSNGDRIRNMTDEELAYFMVIQAIMGAISVNGIQDKAAADKIAKEIIMEHKADEDISAALLWLKQEVMPNDKVL